MITFTKVKLQYGWMGNMSPHSITDKDIVYPTAEHHFQLARLPKSHPVRYRVLATRSPMAAKLLVRTHSDDFIIGPLGKTDINNMRRTLKLKFSQWLTLRDELVDTSPELIVEDVTMRQTRGTAMFWGGVPTSPTSYRGENMLGKLLMELRKDLIEETL